MNIFTNTILTSTFTLILSAGYCFSKGNDVGGKVADSQNKALDYVTVSLVRSKDSTLVKTEITDDKGGFTFKDIPQGTYRVVLTQVGLKKYYSQPITVIAGKEDIDLGTMVMEPDNKKLEEVVVTAQKPLVERKGDKLIVNVAVSSVSAGSSALEVLQKAPGVSLDKDDNISLRGKQGVLVLIDGKPTYLSSADLTSMLRNMQSNEIESLEIITNPSARYEAEGKSGIINIRLKKNKSFGTNGTATAGAGYSGYRKTNGGISINNRSERLNFFGNYNYSNNEGEQSTDIDRINDNMGLRSRFAQTGSGVRHWSNHNFKAGADFFINKNHTVGVIVNGYFNKWNENLGNSTIISSLSGVADSAVKATNTGNSSYRNVSYNLNYKGILDSNGRELSIDADYSNNHSNDRMQYDNLYLYNTNKNEVRELLKNYSPSDIDIYAFKADYTHPLSKSLKMEAGYKSSWVEADNDFRFNRFEDDGWNNDPRRSNHFLYTENINAVYVNLKKETPKWNFQAGVRAEQTNSKGDLVTTGEVARRHYLDFFPSAAVNFTADKNNSVGLTYSRRITRPEYEALNPFEYFLDRYTFNKGNPFLKPEYTNTFDLSYTFQKKYTVSAGYTRTTDGITQVLLPDPEKSALYQTNANLSEQLTYSLNLSIPFAFANWWNSNTNINVFKNQFKSPDLNGQVLDNEQTAIQIYNSQNFVAGKALSFELSGNYQSKVVYGTFSFRPRYTVDFGMSKSFSNKRVNLKLTVNDLFKTRYAKISSAYPGLDYKLFQRGDSRTARLTLSYKFGNNEVKAVRSHRTALEEEAGRLKK